MGVKKPVILSLLSAPFVIGALVIGIYAGSTTDEKPAEKCAECHANSTEFKEWQNSAHADSLKTIQKEPKANTACIKCHSSDYNSYVRSTPWGAKVNPPTPQTAKNPVSCSSCHRHDSGIKHNLLMPLDKLCISCHKFDCG